MRKRIVVTGLGIVSPLGIGISENWKNYLAGISGIEEFEIDGIESKTYAGRVSNDKLEAFVPEFKKDKIDRFTSFALAAAKIALDDAKIDKGLDKETMGVFIGSAFSGINIIEKQIKVLYTDGPRRVHPLLMQNNLTNAPPGEVAIEFNLRGPNIGFSCGGCSGDYSIIQAFNTLQAHNIDAMVAGGTEAPLTPRVFKELGSKGLFHTDNTGLNRASCPFDVTRKGFVLSEGSGIVVLETLKSAEKRGAKVYGELVGFGTSHRNNGSVSQENPGVYYKALCIKRALDSASIDASDVDYINASGISGIPEDIEESEAIKSVFGEDTHRVPVSSIKGSLGYSIGAAGPINAIFSLLSLHKQVLPQTNNLKNIDPKCKSISILRRPNFSFVDIVLSNNFDYAGNNVSLVFKRLS